MRWQKISVVVCRDGDDGDYDDVVFMLIYQRSCSATWGISAKDEINKKRGSSTEILISSG